MLQAEEILVTISNVKESKAMQKVNEAYTK